MKKHFTIIEIGDYIQKVFNKVKLICPLKYLNSPVSGNHGQKQTFESPPVDIRYLK